MPRHLPAELASLGRLVATAPDILRILISATVIALAITVWRLRGRFEEAVKQFNRRPACGPGCRCTSLLSLPWICSAGPSLRRRQLSYQYLAWFVCVIGTALSWLAAAIAPRSGPRSSASAEV